MNLPLRNYRFNHSFSEGRLIFDVGETFAKGGQMLNSGADYLADKAGNITGWFASRGADLATGVPSNFAQGIYDAWNRELNDPAEAKDTQLRTISNFSRTIPLLIQNTIAEHFAKEKPTLTELAEVMNHENWINLFSNPASYLNLAEHPITPLTLSNGPEGILYSLDVGQRKNLYRQYVTKVIALEVTDNAGFKDIFGDSALQSPPQRADTMIANNGTINQAMRLSLGIGNGAAIVKANDPTAFNIAKTNLMQHYWRSFERPRDASGNPIPVGRPPDYATTTDPRSVTPEFGDDLKRATGDKMLLGSMEDIRRGLGEKMPSYLKGALDPAMEIFQESDIPDIQQFMLQTNVERQMQLYESNAERRKYSKEIGKEKARNSETIGETFMNLGGIEKALLVFLAYKAFKGAPSMMTGMTALYFGQKFLLKQDDPINKLWVPTIRGLTDKIVDNPLVSSAFKNLNIQTTKKYTSAEMDYRASIADKFLSEQLHTRMQASVTGFTLLGDMEIADLQKYLRITSNGSHAVLDHFDRDFQGTMREKLGKTDLNTKALENFLNNAESFDVGVQNPNALAELKVEKVNEHMLDSGNALAGVYYMISARSPAFKDMMTIVEHYRGMVRNGSYADLPYGTYSYDYNEDGRPDKVNPREMYVAMVKAGMKIASGMKGVTLFDFMQQETRSKELPYQSRTTMSVAQAQAPATLATGVAVNTGLTPTPPLTPSLASTPSSSPSLTPGTPVTPSASPSLTPGTPVTPSASPSITPSPAATPSGSPSLTPSPAATPAGSPSLTPSPVTTPGSAPVLSPASPVSPGTTPTLGASPASTPSTAPVSSPSAPVTPGTSPVIVPNAGANPNATTNILPNGAASPAGAPNAGTNAPNTPTTAPKKIPGGGSSPNAAPSAQAQ